MERQGKGLARRMTDDRLALDLFGSFSAAVSGTPLTGFRSDRARALLAYLAVEGDRPHSRSSLATLLWPDVMDQVALGNLRKALHRLQETLAPAGEAVLLVTRQAIALNPGACITDVTAFQHLLAETEGHGHASLHECDVCMDRLVRAMAVCGGELLEGFSIPDAEPFDEWLRMRRERFQHAALGALYRLTAAYLNRGDYDRALAHAARQVELDPWREAAHRQLMQALAEGGDRAAALVQFERCRTMLEEELGVEPAEETRLLYERILAQDLAPAARRTIQRPSLPASLTPLLGRDADLQAVANLRRDGARLLTLVGAGGMGKTRLALEAARAAMEQYTGGVFFVPLAHLADPGGIPSAIARAVGMTLHGDDPMGELLRALGDKQMLLVLDNLEHLPGATELVVAILEVASGVQIIVTSRQHLGVRGEQIYRVEGLEYGESTRIGEEPSPAAQLFIQSSRRAHRWVIPQKGDLPVIERIATLVQGMPLALEMAAAWTGVLPLADIPDEIERSLDFLQADWADAPNRQQSMRAIFEWSWGLLGEAEQIVLRRLSLFRGGFTREAAETVAGATLRTLASLSQASLVRRQPGNATGTYEVHELLRQFAAERLDAVPGERETVEARHAAYYLALADEASKELDGPSQGEWLDRLEEAYPNIRHVLDRVLERAEQRGAGLSEGLRLATLLHSFWCRRRYLVEGSFYLDRLLALDERWGTATAGIRARAVLAAGFLACFRGDYPLTTTLAQRGIALCEPLADRRGLARAHRLLGEAAMEQGDDRTAEQHFERQLDLAREAGDLVWQGDAYNQLGEVARRLSRFEAATTFLKQSVTIHRSAQHAEGERYAMCGLGQVACAAGDADGARHWFRESLRSESSLTLTRVVAYDLEGLAAAAALDGDGYQALVYLEAAEMVREEIGSPLPPAEGAILTRALSPALMGLSEREQETARAEGRSRSVAQVVADAVGEPVNSLRTPLSVHVRNGP